MPRKKILPKEGPWRVEKIEEVPFFCSDEAKEFYKKFSHRIRSKDGFVVALIYRDGKLNKGQAKAHAQFIAKAGKNAGK